MNSCRQAERLHPARPVADHVAAGRASPNPRSLPVCPPHGDPSRAAPRREPPLLVGPLSPPRCHPRLTPDPVPGPSLARANPAGQRHQPSAERKQDVRAQAPRRASSARPCRHLGDRLRPRRPPVPLGDRPRSVRRTTSTASLSSSPPLGRPAAAAIFMPWSRAAMIDPSHNACGAGRPVRARSPPARSSTDPVNRQPLGRPTSITPG